MSINSKDEVAIVVYGDNFDEALNKAKELVDRENYELVHIEEERQPVDGTGR